MAAQILGKILQVVGNNAQDAANKMKSRQSGGTEAVGPEFRPVHGGVPEQTNKHNGPLDQLGGMIGQMGGQQGFGQMFGQQGAGGAEGAGGTGASAGGAAGASAGAGAGAGGMGAAAGAAGAMGSDNRTKMPIPNTDDLLAQVAESINNYKYHYKPGMGEDPSIEYSGPMAQELLQVDGYRSCVFEDESGLLKIDTGRLALVNAGMIADLTKRLFMLESFIQSVMAELGQMAQMPDVE